MNKLKISNNIDEILDKLWLGNKSAAKDINDLKNKNIKKILTIMDKDEPKYNDEDGFKHKIINIKDLSEQNIIKYFGECLNFIKGDDNVLVHCLSGASRSGSIVIAYVMWIKKMSFNNAFNFVKGKRFIVYPNYGFRQQLKMFEKLLINNEYDIDKIKFDEIKWEPKEDQLHYL